MLACSILSLPITKLSKRCDRGATLSPHVTVLHFERMCLESSGPFSVLFVFHEWWDFLLLFIYLIALVSFSVIVSRYCLEIAGANAATYTYTYFLKVEHWITSEEMLLVGGPLFLVLHPFCTVKRWPLLQFNQLVPKWISFWGIVCCKGWLSSSQRSPVLCPLLCCRMGLLHLCCGGCFWLCSLPFWFLCSL